MPHAIVAFGSNIDPDENVVSAFDLLLGNARVSVEDVSSVYRSEPIGDSVGSARFVNGAVSLTSALPPRDLKREILRPIEAILGRSETDRSGPRPIDLDLITYDNWIVDEDGLRLPDPDWLTRAFVAVPVAELEPAFQHPLTGQSAEDIAASLRSTASGDGMTIEVELSDALRHRLRRR